MKPSEQQAQPTAEDLLKTVYTELRHMAAAKMARERPGQTLQATALVHEAWLRVSAEDRHEWRDQRHFFSAAANAMRRILIENARRKKTPRHGGHLDRVELEDVPAAHMPDDELLAVDEALERLVEEDPEAARLVELRFFVGLGHEEAAEIMGLSRHQADGVWLFARTWLRAALEKEIPADDGKISP